MGNFVGEDGCYSWLRGYHHTIARLRTHFRSKYKHCIYYRTSMTLVDNLHRAVKNGFILPEQEAQPTGQSLIDSLSYQESMLSGSSSSSRASLPTRCVSLNDEEKKFVVSELIKKSYILLDISDVFSEPEQGRHYEKQIKKKIFEEEDSIMSESFCDNRDAIVESLRKFDTHTIFKLEKYVDMAEVIKNAFGEPESHLFKFLLMLKSNLIQSYNRNHSAVDLFHNTRLMIRILQSTIEIIFQLRLPSHKHYPQNILNQEDNGIEFLNEINLHTLSTCLVFEDPSFHDFFESAVTDIFAQQLTNYRRQTVMTDQAFIAKLLGQDSSMASYFEPTIVELFNKHTENSYKFEKTFRMFSMLPKKLPPVLKLKLLGEVEKQFLRELKTLYKEKDMQMVYDRNISQQLAGWLINRDKAIGQRGIISIIMAYAFVHNMYRVGAKGSIMLSFVENVERLLGWSIPTDYYSD